MLSLYFKGRFWDPAGAQPLFQCWLGVFQNSSDMEKAMEGLDPIHSGGWGKGTQGQEEGARGLEWGAEGELHDPRLSNRQRGSDLGPQMDCSRARGPITGKAQDERAVCPLSPIACRMGGRPERGLSGYVGSGTLIIHRPTEANDLIFPDRQTPTSLFWA